MGAFFGGIFTGLKSAWDWFTGSPVGRLLGAALLWLLAWEVVKHELEQSGARKERSRNSEANARAQVEVARTQATITQERNDDRARADAAVENLPDYTGPEQLRRDTQRPGLYAILFGDAAAGDGPAEGRRL